MAIQAQLNCNSGNAGNIGFPLICGGSGFSLVTNGGFDQPCSILQTLKNHNQQILSHEQPQYQSSFAAHMERQNQEIDQLIRSQNERLRFVLQEQRKQQMQIILRKMEEKASVMITQKDLEIAKASTKKMELEALLRKMEMESQTWQRLARENEEMVATLSNALEQVKERASCFGGGDTGAEAEVEAEDEGSCCGGGETPVVAGGCLDGEKKTMMKCTRCGFGETCVLFLPCRHLCCCRDCGAILDTCPVCTAPKKASIEALIF